MGGWRWGVRRVGVSGSVEVGSEEDILLMLTLPVVLLEWSYVFSDACNNNQYNDNYTPH